MSSELDSARRMRIDQLFDSCKDLCSIAKARIVLRMICITETANDDNKIYLRWKMKRSLQEGFA